MKRLRFLVISFALAVLFPCVATAAELWPADAPAVPQQVRRLMQDRNYAEAVKAIDAAAAAPDAAKDYLAYLKGQALSLEKRYDEAAAAFDAMQKDFPNSPWLRRARLAKATALARKGDFRAAEVIFRAEAEYLLSTDRKQQIADIYLEFADALFKPAKSDQKPDYAKAFEFYKKAIEVGPEPEKRIEVELRMAECQQNLANYPAAIALYEKFIKERSDEKAAEEVARRNAAAAAKTFTDDLDMPFLAGASPAVFLTIEASFRLGECRLAAGEGNVARRVWEDLLDKYDWTKDDRIADAQFQLARTWNIPKPQSDEELNLGVSALRAFIERFPKHKLASRAHLEIAESYVERGRYADAAAALRLFLGNPQYQDRKETPIARNLLGRCLQLQKKYTEAIEAWRDYLAKYPSDKEWSNVQREIINTEYLMAREKLEAKQYDAANRLFGEFLAKYPLDERVPDILLLMNRKVVEEKKWEEAIAGWRRIVSKYPESEAASQAQFDIAETLETKLGKFEEALDEYRKTTHGHCTAAALQAIARLTATSMSVATERIFRSDETPKLKLVSRNVESVTVRAYKVDLETYFRKMHLARGVEGLDISLIDPDKTFEFKVPGYVKHRQSQCAIEVPLPGGARTGVMAVSVSSKTLETTTLVIRSDLDVIVKSSRDEVFVFAENMRTGKPWPGARLLISNGQQVFAEATTGGDGVLQKSYKELKDAADVRVFAVADGNVASNVIDLQGVGVAEGLGDKGYIYTDRPAYRAGQIVHVRGCLRRAIDDAYTVEKGKKFTLDVHNSRNRLLSRETVKLGRFGTFHAYVVLPPTSSQGLYRVSVHDDAGQNYTGTFQVNEYHLEPLRLTIDTPRNVYYRGEEIEGVVRATYYYRAPAGRPRNPLSTGRRPRAHRRNRRERGGAFQAADAGVQRDPVAAAAGCTARAKSGHDGQLHAGGAGVFDPRERRAADLYGRRDVRGDRQHAGRRREAARPETDAESARADGRQRHGGRAARRGASDRDGRRRRGSQNTEDRQGGRIPCPRRGDRPLQEHDQRTLRRADFRRPGPRAAAHSGRHAHVQSRRDGGDQGALARTAGAGARDVPGGPRAGVSTRRAEAGRQPAFHPHDRAASPNTAQRIRTMAGRNSLAGWG